MDTGNRGLIIGAVVVVLALGAGALLTASRDNTTRISSSGSPRYTEQNTRQIPERTQPVQPGAPSEPSSPQVVPPQPTGPNGGHGSSPEGAPPVSR